MSLFDVLHISCKHTHANVIIWHERHLHIENIVDVCILVISEPGKRASFEYIKQLRKKPNQ